MHHSSTLPAYFQHAIGCTFRNPRLKPGAFTFDAFSILVSGFRVPTTLSSDTAPLSQPDLSRSSRTQVRDLHAFRKAESHRLKINLHRGEFRNPRLKPGAFTFDAFSILVSGFRVPTTLSSDTAPLSQPDLSRSSRTQVRDLHAFRKVSQPQAEAWGFYV